MENTSARGGKRPGAGRPSGARSTQPSSFVARLRSQMKVSQADLAVTLGVREKTVWRYEKEGIIPTNGETREKLEQLGKEHGVALIIEEGAA